MSEDAEASVVARPEMIGAGHNAYLEAVWAVRRFGLVVGFAGLVWLVALRSVGSWCGRLVGGVDGVWSLRRIGTMVVNESSIWLRMRCHTQPYGRRRGTIRSLGVCRLVHARAYTTTRYRYIRAPGRLLPSHSVCSGTLAIGGPGHMTNPIASPDADDITEFSDALACLVAATSVGMIINAFGSLCRGCVRIGSHDDRLVGWGGVMWRGLAVLCEDLLTWWRCGRLWKRRFGLGISARRKSGGADFHGESSLVAGHGRDEGVR